MSKFRKAYVLLSGGLDSTVCLYLANRQAQQVVACSVDYEQRHKTEIMFAKASCAQLGIPHKILPVPNLPTSMLTDKSAAVPDISYDEIQGVSPTYVPFRNGLLLSRLAAEAQAGDGDAIYFGAHSEDAANWAYPDCTPEFIGSMANAIYIGTYHQVRLITPLQWMMKTDIVKLGYSINVDFGLTWSCYKGGQKHCGVCPTCRSRRQAFIDADVFDPTEYEV
jgi:7-cyano-7-deazaguanine synthase